MDPVRLFVINYNVLGFFKSTKSNHLKIKIILNCYLSYKHVNLLTFKITFSQMETIMKALIRRGIIWIGLRNWISGKAFLTWPSGLP